MTASRDRKEAAKRLGITLAVDYRRLVEASGSDEVTAAAVTLGENFNANIEFIIWVLKEFGGVDQMPFARQHRPGNGLPKMPSILLGQD